MKFRSLRAALFALVPVILSCGREPTAPVAPEVAAFGARANTVTTSPVIISQIYGGGGNAGAVFLNDFVELFNRSGAAVSVGGWRIHYGSSSGTSWTNTTTIPAGTTIAAGKYLLIGGASGGTNGGALPAVDVTGSINLSATQGKVILTNASVTLAALACPTDAAIVDQISYDGTNCAASWTTTGNPANATAVIRGGAGCLATGNLAVDFSVATPTPRNSATSANLCVPKVVVNPATAAVTAGNTQLFSASETDASGNPVSTTFTWSTSDANIATVSASGLATGLQAGTATITATASDNTTGTATITVNVGGVATVTVTPNPVTIAANATQQFMASATDAGGNPVSTTFTWASSDGAVASINATGLATGTLTGGATTITATAANGIAGSATLNVTPLPSQSGNVVISQIYGGGGNANATYTNDYIEIFNRTTSPVSINGWSVQYASAGGSFNAATPLTGTIQPGQYLLVQEATGGANGIASPTADFTGSINMSGTAGKVLLAQTSSPIGTVCPTGNVIVDVAAYGSGTNCGTSTPNLSSTSASFRRNGGCKYTPDVATDFQVLAPNPRNSASPVHSCVVGPLDHVSISGGTSVLVGATLQLSADALDGNDNTVAGAVTTWSTDDPAVATVSAGGLVTGVSSTNSPATITASVTAGGVTKTATVEVSVTNPGGINWIDLSSRSVSLPPGFQTDVFVTAREAQGGTIIPATFTFEVIDAANISVVNIPNSTSGLLTALAPTSDGSKPRVKITATPTGGGASYSFTGRPVTVETPVAASPSIYGNNVAFGAPTNPGSNPNDFLIDRPQYRISYNQSLGVPNWVSYELDSRQMIVGQDRCNCFTADPLLPAAQQVFVYDYTNSGYDRGHLARSADRTAANVDNAITFYMTNMTPQAPGLNQGPWALFENMLGDSARVGGRAVYIVTGPLFTTPLHYAHGTDRAAIPDSMWKVALIGPRNGGIPFDQVSDWNQVPGLSILAVTMPNSNLLANGDSTRRVSNPLIFKSTVESIEQSTGYDIMSLLSAAMTKAIQYHDRAPTAAFSRSGTQNEGSVITFDASASTDPDLGRTDLGGLTEGLTYSWTFGDGGTATGQVVTHTFADDGNYNVRLTVTDVFGWPVSTTTSVAIANVAPTATLAAPANVNEGSAIALALNAANDAGAIDVELGFTYAFDCGTGSGYGVATSASTASCPTSQPGSRTVRGKVIDKDGGETEYSASVTIDDVAPAIAVFAGASIFRTETYSTGGSFTDPGANAWTATVNYGDGGGVTALPLTGKSFALSHTYATAGTFTVTVSVSDGYVTTTRTQTVIVLSSIAALGEVVAQINAFQGDGIISSGNANSMKSKVEAAVKSLEKGNKTPALNQLSALLNEINAEESSGRLAAADATTLRTLVNRVIASITG